MSNCIQKAQSHSLYIVYISLGLEKNSSVVGGRLYCMQNLLVLVRLLVSCKLVHLNGNTEDFKFKARGITLKSFYEKIHLNSQIFVNFSDCMLKSSLQHASIKCTRKLSL